MFEQVNVDIQMAACLARWKLCDTFMHPLCTFALKKGVSCSLACLPSRFVWRHSKLELKRVLFETLCLYIAVCVYFCSVSRREGSTTMMNMVTRMLRRQGFYRVKNQEEPCYMKHSVGLGGVYVRIEQRKALITVRDLGIEEEFTRVKKLENFINQLDDEAYRKKCFIVHKMRGTGS